MNITDVGHLTGDNEGDADTGEDRMEKAKKKEGKNAWEIAKFYTEDFKKGYQALNLTQPIAFLAATEHIPEQIALVERIEKNGLAYRINDGMYFDTVAYEARGYRYGELSNLDQIKAGARVEFNAEKRDPRDFALWKFSPTDGTVRDMEWPSPWGVGFPGWHIECSAMSMSVLGAQFDLHIGGEDLKSTHHPNEIAQSQGASDKAPFVRHWMHGAFLQIDGGRMGKSLGNAYTLHDLKSRGYSPLALRYFYFSGHYRNPLNFTWEGLDAATTALGRIRQSFAAHTTPDEQSDEENIVPDESYKDRFMSALNDDLNLPLALSVLHELLKDKTLSAAVIQKTALDFDRVLGLDLGAETKEEIPEVIQRLAQEREDARRTKDWSKSDELRAKITEAGYEVKDTDTGPVIHKI
jgi:cysteinyl-tRNA synthetase